MGISNLASSDFYSIGRQTRKFRKKPCKICRAHRRSRRLRTQLDPGHRMSRNICTCWLCFDLQLFIINVGWKFWGNRVQ